MMFRSVNLMIVSNGKWVIVVWFEMIDECVQWTHGYMVFWVSKLGRVFVSENGYLMFRFVVIDECVYQLGIWCFNL